MTKCWVGYGRRFVKATATNDSSTTTPSRNSSVSTSAFRGGSTPCTMYEDTLDGRIANEHFDTKAAEMRAAQAAIMRDLEAHQTANWSYIEEGVQLLALAHRAPALFESQPPAEKRKLLNFVLSNFSPPIRCCSDATATANTSKGCR